MANKTPFVEKQRDILLERFGLALPDLYENLKVVCGKNEGERIFKAIAEEKFKKNLLPKIKGIDIDTLMNREEGLSSPFDWKLKIEEKTENGEKVWYETLWNCPHLKATQKHNLPSPCEPVCYTDFWLLEKYGILKAKLVSHILEGAEGCCFRVMKVK